VVILVVSFTAETWAPGIKVAFEVRDKLRWEWEIEYIGPTVSLGNFELLACEGNTPALVLCGTKVLMELHLTHIAGAVGDKGPEAQDER